MRSVVVGVLLALAGCTPNPRNEIVAIASAAMAEAQRTAPGQPLCVQRLIARWTPAATAHRHDPPAPPGYGDLYADGVFRGGGGIAAQRLGAVAVGGRPGCLELRGPLVSGDRAMIELYQPGLDTDARPGTGWNVWLQRIQADWRVVMTTTSVYDR